jgi:hypothetical protein
LIATRVQRLAEAAERERPAWTTLLGQIPADDHCRDHWLNHIAAYRDQHQTTTDDPHQFLGPYPGPGHAGHTAYWHAVQSIHAARHLASLHPATNGVTDQDTGDNAATRPIYAHHPAAALAERNHLTLSTRYPASRPPEAPIEIKQRTRGTQQRTRPAAAPEDQPVAPALKTKASPGTTHHN